MSVADIDKMNTDRKSFYIGVVAGLLVVVVLLLVAQAFLPPSPPTLGNMEFTAEFGFTIDVLLRESPPLGQPVGDAKLHLEYGGKDVAKSVADANGKARLWFARRGGGWVNEGDDAAIDRIVNTGRSKTWNGTTVRVEDASRNVIGRFALKDQQEIDRTREPPLVTLRIAARGK